MSRKVARENAYKSIFAYLFHNELDKDMLEIYAQEEDMSKNDVDYLYKVTLGVVDKYDELVEMIQENAKNFKCERIFRPDMAGLLLACYEIKFMDDIPPKATISSIVDIVKMYSTEKSNVFVNGVLAGVYKQIENK